MDSSGWKDGCRWINGRWMMVGGWIVNGEYKMADV